MRPELILTSVLAVSVSALEARQAQQTSYPISQSEYLARKAAYEAGTVYTDQIGNYAGTYGNQGVVLAPVAPNNAAWPKEELLGPFGGIASHIGHSVESPILGKVTSLPASVPSSLQSSIQAEETQILDAALNSTSTVSSKGPRETGHDDETSQKGSGQKVIEEKDSGASALLLGSGGPIIVALIALGLLLVWA